MADNKTAWLIETGDHMYWDGRGIETDNFTKKHDDAVRFATVYDANRVIYHLLQRYRTFLVAREHAWMDNPNG